MRIPNRDPFILIAWLLFSVPGCVGDSSDDSAALDPGEPSTSQPTTDADASGPGSTGAGTTDGPQATDSGVGTTQTQGTPVVDAGTPSADAGSGTTETATEVDAGVSTDAGVDAPMAEVVPSYAAFGGRFGPFNNYIEYAVFLDSLDDHTEIDIDQTVDMPDGINQFFAGPERDGTLFIADGTSPVMRKFTVGAGGELTPVAELSFASLGWPSIPGDAPSIVVSSTKAYTFDTFGATAVAWNPEEMTMSGTIVMEDLWMQTDVVLGGYNAGLGFVVEMDSRIAFVFNYYRQGQPMPSTRVAFIDPSDDSYQVSAVPSTCAAGLFGGAAVNEAGDLYISSSLDLAIETATGAVNDPSLIPCMARVLAGETEFDDSYFVNLTELSPTVTGALIQGSGDTAYLKVRSPGLPGPFPGFPATVEVFDQNWELYRVELGSESSSFEPVDLMGLYVFAGSGFHLELDQGEAPFIVATGEAGLGTDVSSAVDLTDPAAPAKRLDAPGFMHRVVRLR